MRNTKIILSAFSLIALSVSLLSCDKRGNVNDPAGPFTLSYGAVSYTHLAVNKTSRGVKLDYKITRIEIKETAATNSTPGENNIFSKN